tara:strand:+ start:238 stop:444 length:207 start_codon:yes stop_codon:yes gene_type:complete
MNSYSEKIFNGIFKVLLMFAALPFMIIINAFKGVNDMGGYMMADYRIEKEKDRGVTFVSTNGEYTRVD